MAEFATIAPTKRIDVAINAVGDLKSRGRSVELFIAGQKVPQYVDELNRLIKRLGLQDHVGLGGFVENVFPAMAVTNAVVISAPVYALGRTAIEGMLLAKAVVYPLGTAFDDYLEDGFMGLGHAAGDPHAVADRIDVLIQPPDLGDVLSRKAQASARFLHQRTVRGEVLHKGPRVGPPRTRQDLEG